MTIKTPSKKIILFTCNWHALHSLEDAGTNKISYLENLYPLRVSCLGRISAGMLLRAFEKGAVGVYLVGCQEDDCRYHSRIEQIQETVSETRKLIKLLGYQENQLQAYFTHAGEGVDLIEDLLAFQEEVATAEVVS